MTSAYQLSLASVFEGLEREPPLPAGLSCRLRKAVSFRAELVEGGRKEGSRGELELELIVFLSRPPRSCLLLALQEHSVPRFQSSSSFLTVSFRSRNWQVSSGELQAAGRRAAHLPSLLLSTFISLARRLLHLSRTKLYVGKDAQEVKSVGSFV